MKKYVLRFSPDYSCTSLWPDNELAKKMFNNPIEYEEVGLSSRLVKALETFDDSVMNILDWNNPVGPSPLSVDERFAIYQEGKRLLEFVRRELGNDFEVLDCLDWLNPNIE